MTSEQERQLRLRAAAQIALLGQTPHSLRSLSLRHADQAVWFKAILASDATDDDREEISCVATEILASLDGRWEWEEEVFISDGSLRGAELEVVVYRRKE